MELNLKYSFSVAGEVSSPVYNYPHTTPPPDVSVIGGYYYRGCLFPNLQGLYIYAHFTGYRIMIIGAPPKGHIIAVHVRGFYCLTH